MIGLGALGNSLLSNIGDASLATITLIRYHSEKTGYKEKKDSPSKKIEKGEIKEEEHVAVGGAGSSASGSTPPAAPPPPPVDVSAVKTALNGNKLLSKGFSLPGMSNRGRVGSGVTGTIQYKSADNTYATSYVANVFNVFFNPNTLTIGASGNGLFAYSNYGDSAKDGDQNSGITGTIAYRNNSRVNMTLNVDLLFDRSSPTNDFSMFDPGNTSLGLSTIANAVSFFLDEHSVLREVEGFIGAIAQDETCELIFDMGDMSYRGAIRGVSAEYTMFSPKGDPVRAIVHLQMYVIDSTLGVDHKGSMFEDAFKAEFDTADPIVMWAPKTSVIGNIIKI